MKFMSYLSHTQTSGVRTAIDEIFAPVLFVQSLSGNQVLDSNWSWRKNGLKLLSCGILLSYVIKGTIDFMHETDDIMLFSEAILTLIVTIQAPVKMLIFIHYRFTFREVYFMAKNSLFREIIEISPERNAYVPDSLRKMVKVLFCMVIMTIFNYLITALWFYIHGERVTLSRTTSIIMPMTSPTYEIGLILHLIYLFMVTFALLVLDMWFVFLTFMLCEISDCAVKILLVEKRGVRDASYADRLNEALGKFYSVHVKIVKYLGTLNAMYKWQVLVPLFSISAITCVFLLVVTEEVNWQLGTVIFIGFTNVSAYCMLGEKIKSKAEEINMALLKFDWMNMKLKERRNYCIIVCYMIKDFSLRTAIGLDLSLVTLSSIYKASYQAFAFLNTMKN